MRLRDWSESLVVQQNIWKDFLFQEMTRRNIRLSFAHIYASSGSGSAMLDSITGDDFDDGFDDDDYFQDELQGITMNMYGLKTTDLNSNRRAHDMNELLRRGRS